MPRCARPGSLAGSQRVKGFGEGIYQVTYPVSALSGVRYRVIVDNLPAGGGIG
jgi:hypothetical protein